MSEKVILNTNLKDIPLYYKGKVRDIYDLANVKGFEDCLLFIATDRISAFDVILPKGIPYKGKVLTQISIFWFNKLKNIVKNHIVTADIKKYPQILKKYENQLIGRSMIVKKTKPILIECVVRGYLAGSGYKDYLATGKVCQIKLPKNLQKGSQLPQAIFTPATKAQEGHDKNVGAAAAIKIAGKKTFNFVREKSLAIYNLAHNLINKRGLILADTKFEFGYLGNEIILVDEVLTPDSSRFWDKKLYKVGEELPNFDKQFVRDYLETLDWNKKYPAPKLPKNIVKKTSEKYLQVFKIISGRELKK